MLSIFLSLACVDPEPPDAQACSLPDAELEPELPPDRAAAGLVYEVYVRSFQDSDGDGVGDLEGLRSRLDYLVSLGVDTIWLMPIFPSVGPAGYDVLDFDRIREDYGDDAALDALLADAHEHGLRVIADLPFNHVARTHPWFAGPDTDPDDPDRALFVFADARYNDLRWFPAAGGGYYYGYFGADLPDLDWEHPEARARMEEVFASWLDAGLDGYRLDAVPTLIEEEGATTNSDATHALLAELYADAHAEHPETLLLAEASEEDTALNLDYLGSEDCREADRVLDFPRRRAMLESLLHGRPARLRAVLDEQRAAGSLGMTAPFLSSHDLSRLPGEVPSAEARRMLQVVELLLPGDPVLYYGEELDLADASTATGQDYAWRAPMPWDASPNGGFTTTTAWLTPDPGYLDGKNVADMLEDPASPLRLVQALGCVRATLDGADFEELAVDDDAVFAFERDVEDGRVVVVANFGGDAPGDLRVDTTGVLRELTTDDAVDASDGLRVRGLAGYGYAVYAEGPAEVCVISP